MEIQYAKDIIPNNKNRIWEKPGFSLFLLAMPFIILIFIFSYVPLFGWLYSFIDYKPGLKLYQCEFVGFKYFKMALSAGSQLPQVLTNTFALSFIGLALSPLEVIFAIFLSEMRSIKFKKLIQTTTTLPYFVSWVIVYSIAYAFFSSDYGFVNMILMKLNIIKEPFQYLANADIAWYFQVVIGSWKNLGFDSIIYIAAIAGINSELYDAAKVDGAGRFRVIWNIVVPGVLPTYFVMLLLGISNVLNNGFEQYYVFYNAMVAEKLNVLDYYVYKTGIATGSYSFATAIGMFKSVVSVTLLFSANWIAKKIRGEAIF